MELLARRGPVRWSGAALPLMVSALLMSTLPALAAVPSAPTEVTATPGIGQATASWTAVADASSYTVTSSPGALTCTSPAPTTSCIVTGLAPATSYTFTVTATNSGGTSSASDPSAAVTTLAGIKVVALGDSVMSGFGYFAESSQDAFYTPPEMNVTDLPDCRPLFFSDATTTPPQIGANSSCSSNVTTRDRETPLPPDVPWAPDYGYWNQVAWSSQFAKAVNAALDPNLSDANVAASFRNFGISGSTAVNWAYDQITFRKAGDNTIYEGLDGVIKEYPDVITVTLGANPTLGQVLFGGGNACRFVSDFYTCFRNLILTNNTRTGLTSLYTDLLRGTAAKDSTILVTLYPTIIPAATLFTAGQLMIAVEALNDVIEESVDAAREFVPAEASRLLVTSAVFNSGLPPGNYSEFAPCFGPAARGSVGTDGPSNQSAATQAVFSVTRALFGWCKGTPYIISGDNGIHPNKTGYGVMAAAAKVTYDARSTATPPSFAAATPLSSVEVNTTYGPYRFTATGSPTPFFSLKEGALPPGMQLTTEGFLGGTPTATGTYSFKVRASNGVSAADAETSTLQIQVNAAPSPSSPDSSPPAVSPNATVTPPASVPPEVQNVPAEDTQLVAIETSPTSVSAAQMAALNPTHIAALPSSVLRQIPAAAFRGMTAAQVQSLTESQVGALRPSQVRALRPVTLRAMRPDEIRKLRPKAVANLRPAQLRLLRPKQLRALTTRQVKALKPAQVTQLARESRGNLLRR